MAALRQSFTAELEQLRLQVELMALRVDQNLEYMREVLRSGNVALAERALAADDEIDAMNVSLMERCYELLRREAPVASDLRFVVSVLRLLSEVERIGDLALRVHRVGAEQHDLLVAEASAFAVLVDMADEAVERFRGALRAWATLDLDLAAELALSSRSMDLFTERLMVEVLGIEGPHAARAAVALFAAGRALERIGDHAGIIGARLRYLITGDPNHLAAEVR